MSLQQKVDLAFKQALTRDLPTKSFSKPIAKTQAEHSEHEKNQWLKKEWPELQKPPMKNLANEKMDELFFSKN